MHTRSVDSLALQVFQRAALSRIKTIGDLIGEHTIDFFWHATIIAAQTGLDVGHRNMQFASRQCAGQSAISVTINKHPIWFFGQHQRFELFKHTARVFAVCAAAHPQVVAWVGNV